VTVRDRNVSVNGAAVPEGDPHLHNSVSVWWPGAAVVVNSGLGVRVKVDSGLVAVTVGTELRGGTRGLCGPYNDDPTDDLQQPDGTVAVLTATFGNSWKRP
ncbi:SSPO protein, partial [Crypturellus undulatus]|nr:SSPO protein [Crypturellus undulatus]